MITEEKTEIVGDYVILKDFGLGVLGEFYEVEHRFLKEKKLLKLLPKEMNQNPGFIKRLETEIGFLARLDHPNILKIENVGSFDGRYFILYEYFESVQQEEYTEDEIVNIAIQVASSLDYVHKQSFHDAPLSHRSLNSENILIDENCNVKVTDFGLTKIAGIEELLKKTYENMWNTMKEKDVAELSSSFLKFYNFMAPELKNKINTLAETDVKADIYSFGVFLYKLLTNQYPEGIFSMPSASKKNWDPIIEKCLQYSPEKRPETLSDLIETLDESTEMKPMLKPQEIKRPEYEPDPAAVFQTDKTVAIYTPKKPDIKEMEPIQTEMVIIEGGTFLRGSNQGARDEMPRHPVHLKSFAIDIHPVTNEQFVRFLAVMGGEKDVNNHDIIRLRDSRIRRTGGKLTIESGYAKHPVVGVTWYGALAYAKWIGKRLPLEAEWEVAACGGLEGALYPTGEKIERTQANFFSSDTTTVMSYPPNEIGLYDMVGNVYEWCMDWYGYHYYETSMQEPDQPSGPPQGVYRVLRGGCWKSLKEDLRVSHRHRNNPGAMNGTSSFRCAADVREVKSP